MSKFAPPFVVEVVKDFGTPVKPLFFLRHQLAFIIVGAHVVQIRMQPLDVIEHGNIFQDVLLSLVACLVVPPLNAFLLETIEKAFNHRVAP